MSGNYEKEIKRAAENIGAVRTDVYLVKRWQAGWVLGFAALMLVGCLFQVIFKNMTVRMVGVGLVLGGVVAILIMYLIIRAHGPMNYTNYYYRSHSGTEYLFQVFGRKHAIVSFGDKILECKGRSVFTRSEIFRADIPWDFFKTAAFSVCEPSKFAGFKYTGARVACGKVQHVSLFLKSGALDFAEADGVRMRYFDINNLNGKLTLPPELYDAANKAGADLGSLGFVSRGK